MNVWRVVYDSRFSSASSVDGPYHKDYKDVTELVITIGDALRDVEVTIRNSMDNQTHLTCLKKVEWLGKAIGGRAL
jgi:hypothetical protein